MSQSELAWFDTNVFLFCAWCLLFVFTTEKKNICARRQTQVHLMQRHNFTKKQAKIGKKENTKRRTKSQVHTCSCVGSCKETAEQLGKKIPSTKTLDNVRKSGAFRQ